jgi:sterol desaturase/sphingolipid hydroxylase (fatty acid hydroxylase superfamily)
MIQPMFLPDAILVATPVFVTTLVLEAVLTKCSRIKGSYETRDTATSLAMGFGSLVAALMFAWIGVDVLVFAYRFHVFEIGFTWWAFGLAVVLDDLVYYWAHRIDHRSRWFWASHVVHHSSQHYNLSTALRQTWTGNLSGLFFLEVPLALLGFHPVMLAFVAGLNLVYQFFMHTEAIGRLPRWIELVFNTPAHHRVHHARDVPYLDCNFAGVFSLWDHLFGTSAVQLDELPPHFGLVENIGTFNPLRVATHEFVAIAADLGRPGLTLRQRAGYLFAPPGWSHDGSRSTANDLKRAAAAAMPCADGSRVPAAAALSGSPLRNSAGPVMQPAGVPDPRGVKQVDGRHGSRHFGASVSC